MSIISHRLTGLSVHVFFSGDFNIQMSHSLTKKSSEVVIKCKRETEKTLTLVWSSFFIFSLKALPLSKIFILLSAVDVTSHAKVFVQ